jgi:hypothetical protein
MRLTQTQVITYLHTYAKTRTHTHTHTHTHFNTGTYTHSGVRSRKYIPGRDRMAAERTGVRRALQPR